jgi:hypothetical protein
MMMERWLASALVIAAAALIGACAPTPRTFGPPGGSAGSGGGGAPDAVCGDGAIGGEEQCDGAALGGATCASVEGPGHFARPGQALGCKPDCTFDVSACTNACTLDAAGSALDACVLQ